MTAENTTPYPLNKYIGKHEGETAWIFGKGPGLDLFNMDQAGPLRCGINDVIGRVPGCLYAFANDSVRDWVDLYEPHHTLFTPSRTVGDDFLRAVIPNCCDTVIFADDYERRIPCNDRTQLAKCLQVRRGTLGSAVQILWIMGVTKIVAVGIDGGNTHASGEWRTRLRAEHFQDYNAIRDQFIDACDLLGIELEMFNHDYKSERNGKMKVEILRDLFVRENAYRVGETPTLSPEDAKALIADRSAVYCKAKPVGNDETATQPPATAAKPAGKGKGKVK